MSSLTSSALYQHIPLRSLRSIRVLQLAPSPTFDSPLRCSLVEIDLDNYNKAQHGYVALSYCWGYRRGDREILCDDRTLLVTRNCEDALRRLRRKDSTQTFWVDAICINQGEDTEALRERSNQIRLMGEVYSSTTSVIVWLGVSGSSTGLIMKSIRKYGNYCDQKTIGNFPQRLYATLMLKRFSRRSLGFSESNRMIDAESHPIFESPWIRRMWTIQEVAFSSVCRVAIGYDSNYSEITWKEFVDAFHNIVLITELDHVFTASINLKELMRRYLTLLHISKCGSSQIQSLGRCLALIGSLEATESRDHAYAIYPLLQQLGIRLEDPDYSRPVETIYEDLTRQIISSSGRLIPLRYICTRSRRSMLASWVADWEQKRVMLLPDVGDEYGSVSSMTFPSPGYLKVHGTTICTVNIRANRDCASFQAVQISTATPRPDKSTLLNFWCDQRVKYIQVLKEWIHLLRHETYLAGDQSKFCALLNLLSLGLQAPSKRKMKAFETWLSILEYPNVNQYDLSGCASMVEWCQEELTIDPLQPSDSIDELLTVGIALSYPEKAGPTGSALPYAKDIKELDLEFHTQLKDRAFFITDRGQMGTTFHTVREGDEVVLFENTKEPYVLRRVGEHYILIGPAYIPELLDSTELRSKASGEMRKFTLV